MLSDAKIRKLKPTDKCTPARSDKYSDQQGLQLLVRSSRTKTWISAYRFGGKQTRMTLTLQCHYLKQEKPILTPAVKSLQLNLGNFSYAA